MRKLKLENRPFRIIVEPSYFLKPDSDIEGIFFFQLSFLKVPYSFWLRTHPNVSI